MVVVVVKLETITGPCTALAVVRVSKRTLETVPVPVGCQFRHYHWGSRRVVTRNGTELVTTLRVITSDVPTSKGPKR